MPWRSGASLARQNAKRIHVEVLPVEVDALFGEQPVDVVGQPLPGRRGRPGSAAALLPPSSHSGWFLASQVPGVTRSGSNQTISFMPFAWT